MGEDVTGCWEPDECENCESVRSENARLRAALADTYENKREIANLVKDSESAVHRILAVIRRRAGLETGK